MRCQTPLRTDEVSDTPGAGFPRRQELGEDLERDLRGRLAAEVEPDRAVHAVGGVAESLAPLLLRAPRAERADVEAASLAAAAERGQVEALLVHQRDERRLGVDVDLVRPGDDELAGARDALARREPGPRVDDDRPPAERRSERAERLGDVACADRDEARRRSDLLGEHGPRTLLAETGRDGCRVVPALADALAGDDHVARAPLDRRRARERLDEHVDLAPAGKPHAPRLVVGDAVGDQLA